MESVRPLAPDTASSLLTVLHAAVDAIAGALAATTDWGLAGTRPGQHHSDVAADAAAAAVLTGAGLGVLSEESGVSGGSGTVVVLDPLDGSTNASRGVPWYAASLCAVDGDGAAAAVVANLATSERFEATRGGGARRRDGGPVKPSSCTSLADALVGVSGWPPRHPGWHQYRALGAAALDLCAVASGVLDGFIDCSRDAHGVWDYAGASLVCAEAGAVVVDCAGRDLLTLDPTARRTPVAAATPELLEALVAARRSFE
jgi:fructose-1,6-bisphosphatase/inositol monophosphatase family enzyme